VLVAALIGCLNLEDGNRSLLRWEMHNHDADARAARDAIAADRMAAARDAGLRLAWPDPAPGLPDPALRWLASVRGAGEALSRETDRTRAASRLLDLTADCAGCHRELGVATPSSGDLAWTALLFEDEAAWNAGLGALDLPTAAAIGAPGWPARRSAYAVWLARK